MLKQLTSVFASKVGAIALMFFLMFTIMPSQVMAATPTDSPTEQVVALPDSATLTAAKVYDDIKAGLSGLAAALKVGAEHVFEVLILQQLVYAIVYLILFIISISSGIGAYKLICKGVVYENKRDDRAAITFAFGMGLIILSVLTGLISVFNIDTIVTGFINPEYGAIKDIVNFIK